MVCNLTIKVPGFVNPHIGPLCKYDADPLTGPGSCCYSHHTEHLEDHWPVPVQRYCNFNMRFNVLREWKCFSCSGRVTEMYTTYTCPIRQNCELKNPFERAFTAVPTEEEAFARLVEESAL